MKSQADEIADLPEAEREFALSGLGERALADLEWDWRFWARPEQMPPPDLLPNGNEWLVWMILAGRGFGKTRSGAEFIREEVKTGRMGRIALIGETAADARDVIVEGQSGLLAISPKDERPDYEPSKRRLTWPNGAVASLFNATEPDQLRGPQFDGAWCDELAKWQYAQECWDQLQFGLRLGTRPRIIVTTTPRPIPLVKEILKSPFTAITRGKTEDNAGNLATSFLRKVTDRYSGTRLGRQELNAEILDDVPGALWSRDNIEKYRVKAPPMMSRIVVAVDPSGSHGIDSDSDEEAGDDIGIVVVGLGVDGRIYVMGDKSCNKSPDGWGEDAVKAYRDFLCDRLVAEVNYGGAMVEHVIRTVDPNVSYREVRASRGTGGKGKRAEPVSALYAQGRVSHVGMFPELEDQMCLMAEDEYMGKGSPDRADALVWAVHDLVLSRNALAFGSF